MLDSSVEVLFWCPQLDDIKSIQSARLHKPFQFYYATDLLCIEQEWLTNLKITDTPKIHAVQDFLTKVSSTNTTILLNTYCCEKDAFLDTSDLLSNFCTNIMLSNREYSSQDLKLNNTSNLTIAPLGMGASDTWRDAPDAHEGSFS